MLERQHTSDLETKDWSTAGQLECISFTSPLESGSSLAIKGFSLHLESQAALYITDLPDFAQLLTTPLNMKW